MIEFDFNKIGKFKGKGIINLYKIKTDCTDKSYYDPSVCSVCRVIELDNVDSFTMCVEPDEAVKLILEKQGFELILECNNYFVYKRKKKC